MSARGLHIIFYVLILATGSSAGAAGVRGGASGLKDPNSLTGLCTKNDSGQRWVAQGWCKTMRESLEKGKGGCAKTKFSAVRGLAQNGGLKDIEKYCPNIKELAANETHFASFMTNLMAALTIEESDWTEKGPNSSMGAKGLMQLSLASVKQKAYACGCSDIKSDRDLFDAHKNAQCGSYIALHWMDKDKEVGSGSGNNKTSGSKGIARYFQPFRDIDKKKRERMQKKLTNYCKQRGSGNIDLEGSTAGSPTTR